MHLAGMIEHGKTDLMMHAMIILIYCRSADREVQSHFLAICPDLAS